VWQIKEKEGKEKGRDFYNNKVVHGKERNKRGFLKKILMLK
jgi:hypothetical protein